jgi:hypothetical protein
MGRQKTDDVVDVEGNAALINIQGPKLEFARAQPVVYFHPVPSLRDDGSFAFHTETAQRCNTQKTAQRTGCQERTHCILIYVLQPNLSRGWIWLDTNSLAE